MWVAAVFAIACIFRDARVAAQTNHSELEPQLLLLANTPTTCSWGANLACSLTDSTNNLKLGAGCVLPVPIPTDNYVSDKRTNKFDDAQLLTASEQPFVEITSTYAGSSTVDSRTGQVAWYRYKTAPLTSQQSVNFKVPGLYSLSIIATDYDRTAQCDGCVAINDAYRPRYKTGSCPTAPFTTTENILIRSRRDPTMCMDDGGGTSSGMTKFTLAACNPNSANQVYAYDPSKLEFRNVNKNTLCLDDGGGWGIHSTPWHMWECDAANWNQKFTYIAQTGQIENPYKFCFTDTPVSGTLHWFYYEECDTSRLDQQFDLVPQWQLLNVPNPAALTTASLATARTYEGLFDNYVKDANVLNNANGGDDCSTAETKVEYLRDDLKSLSSGSCFSDASLATSVDNLKTSPFTTQLQTPYLSLQSTLADSCQWCCEKSKTLLEKYTEYGCATAPADKGCVGGSGNSCSMNLCLKVFGDTLATVTIGIASAVQTVSNGVLNALPSKPTGSDATKHVYYSVGCTDFSATDSKCHYEVELSKLLTVTTGFAGSFPTPPSETGKINDYVFWRYNLDGGEWKTWSRTSDSKIAFTDASTAVIVEAWTSCGRVGDAFSFDVNLFVHSTLTCSSFDAMWKLEGSDPTPGNAYCAYPGSDFAVMKLDMTVADVVLSSAGKVTGSYAGVTCDIMLKEEATTATNTKAYQLLSDSTNPTISKYFAVEMVHNPHTARKTAAKVTCTFTRTPHSNTMLLAEDTDPNSITCMHDFTVTDCDAPEVISFVQDGLCADKCAGKAAPGVNEACGGTVVRSDATDTSISTTEATCCTDCDPDLTCTAVGSTDVKRCEKSALIPLMLTATEEEKSFTSSSTLVLLGATAMVAVVALVVVKRRTGSSTVHEDAYYPLLE